MEQHPIPQQISSYQFRLVGDMTLKQFFQLAGGALISLLIYSTGLHPILKWPLIIFFFAFGAALAFIPFQDRPLEKWVIAFFRSIYSPTLYFWKPYEASFAFFQAEEATQSIQGQTSSGSVASSSNGNNLPFLSNPFFS
ncbi:PrgI family protein, partial [Candidatus Microgenomates bacterium]|nr:PrgI family protein [Candidatus Microgenomates bacterium]